MKVNLEFIESHPVTCTIIFSVLFSILGAITLDYYRDWKQAAVPSISISDIRVTPESNWLYLADDDLIPTSTELLEYLRGDIRIQFWGLSKLFPYRRYYNYLRQNRNNIVFFDAEKESFLNSLKNILLILKNDNATNKDKEIFFDKVWRNFPRIANSFDVLVSIGSIDINNLPQLQTDNEKKANNIFVFQKVNLNNEPIKEKCILRKKQGALESVSTYRNENWDDLRWNNEVQFYEALERFDKNVLIIVFEKILERYENNLLPDSLEKIEYELDQISRWEIDLIVSNEGDNPLDILPYAFLIVET